MKRKLYELAKGFRRALISCPKGSFSDFQRRHLQNFPTQSCDVASLLLASFLRDRGFQKIERVFGFLDNESHVWLEVDGFVVDITADQFPGGDDPIIVAEITEQPWHSNFRVQSRGPAYSSNAVRADYEKAYAAVKRWLELDSSSPESSC